MTNIAYYDIATCGAYQCPMGIYINHLLHIYPMTYYFILPHHSGSPQPYITWERGGQPTRPATHTSSAQVAFCNRNSVEKVDL